MVVPRLRPLRYPRGALSRPVEKGVDVELAIGAVETTVTNACDVAIIFSNDTDLLPAVEAIVRLKGRSAVETAAWKSDSYHVRLRSKPSVFHHHLTERDFLAAERCVNYADASRTAAGAGR